ncbi:hypothetical protein [Terribacillus saccharophilus]|uniref:hypothetical protein n=1 Tax=Terribacillus saccharophilus TaxID=361277 RepID=UPI002989D560|nr:hypothetical protein [Terribacillus saccharophilus]MCM3227500.1 hypothetical protein [Terribacillus saccharophilus]
MKQKLVVVLILVLSFGTFSWISEADARGGMGSVGRSSPSITPKAPSTPKTPSKSTGSSSGSSSNKSTTNKSSSSKSSSKSNNSNYSTNRPSNTPNYIMNAVGAYLIFSYINDDGEAVYEDAETGEETTVSNFDEYEEVQDLPEDSADDWTLSLLDYFNTFLKIGLFAALGIFLFFLVTKAFSRI